MPLADAFERAINLATYIIQHIISLHLLKHE
jgi:hypothetical protein